MTLSSEQYYVPESPETPIPDAEVAAPVRRLSAVPDLAEIEYYPDESRPGMVYRSAVNNYSKEDILLFEKVRRERQQPPTNSGTAYSHPGLSSTDPPHYDPTKEYYY